MRLAVSVALILFLLRKVNWPALHLMLSRMAPGPALIGSCLPLPLLACLALRWQIFLKQQFLTIPFRQVFALTWAGQFFNSVLPGSTGGDFLKIFQICRIFPTQKATAALTVVVDRVSALLALGCLALIAVFREPLPDLPESPLLRGGLRLWLVAFFFLVGAIIVVASRSARRSVNFGAKWRALLAVSKNGFKLNTYSLAAVALAFVIHILNFGIFFAFARSLGIVITFRQVLLFMPIVFTFVLIPITVNGYGLREVLLIFYFQRLQIGVPDAGIGAAETVVSLSMLGFVNDFLWAIPGGLWYMARFRKTSRTRDLGA